MNSPSPLCQDFARILGGTAEVVNGVCTVTRIRSNLKPLIQGRRTRSALAIAALFSFEDLDSRGNALNLGETVILQEEANPFISALRARGIEVTALHNHWLLTDPVLMFIHWKSIEPPLSFARKTAEAFRVLTTRTIAPKKSSSSGGHRSSRSSHSSRKRRSVSRFSGSKHRSVSGRSGKLYSSKSRRVKSLHRSRSVRPSSVSLRSRKLK